MKAKSETVFGYPVENHYPIFLSFGEYAPAGVAILPAEVVKSLESGAVHLSPSLRDGKLSALSVSLCQANAELADKWTVSGIGMVVAERIRQIVGEGYTDEHDDKHTYEQIAYAAMCYLMAHNQTFVHEFWPWQPDLFKPSTPLRNLVKAGALICAEIDRLLRRGRDYANPNRKLG